VSALSYLFGLLTAGLVSFPLHFTFYAGGLCLCIDGFFFSLPGSRWTVLCCFLTRVGSRWSVLTPWSLADLGAHLIDFLYRRQTLLCCRSRTSQWFSADDATPVLQSMGVRAYAMASVLSLSQF